jgi:hypothetical protein
MSETWPRFGECLVRDHTKSTPRIVVNHKWAVPARQAINVNSETTVLIFQLDPKTISMRIIVVTDAVGTVLDGKPYLGFSTARRSLMGMISSGSATNILFFSEKELTNGFSLWSAERRTKSKMT